MWYARRDTGPAAGAQRWGGAFGGLNENGQALIRAGQPFRACPRYASESAQNQEKLRLHLAGLASSSETDSGPVLRKARTRIRECARG